MEVTIVNNKGLPSLEDALKYCEAQSFSKPFCVVQAWQVFEVKNQGLLNGKDVQPYALHAREILYESTGGGRQSKTIAGVYLVSAPNSFTFETHDTIHILVGPGEIFYFS
ncbi:DUF6957 family protein [Pseudomonas aeruginosa]|uniref:DUF6957 family protein n=1 Tax=Pseudomonas paraeruginosa TaxID=2994495 RepID=UPI0021AE7E22|nr:hypothetical protein [Pseudomonas aeruginosa]